MRYKQKNCLIFIIILLTSVIFYQLFLKSDESNVIYKGSDFPVVLWWTPFGNDGKLRKCGRQRCFFTSNRFYENHPDLKSILFYGSNFRVYDLPRKRFEKVLWGILHEESPRNNPILVHQDSLSLFSFSSTFSRYSDVPLTLVDLPGSRELIDTNYFVPTKKKTELIKKKKIAPVLYIQSDCNTASDRDAYVEELMKYIEIDSYGSCLNNAQLDKKLKENYLDVLKDDAFLTFVANYKLTISFENAVCNDYITEKLWRPLIVGSVPVYYGSPSFMDWLPNNHSAISVQDFESPRHLAEYLNELINNETEYNKYLSHKLSRSIENDHLKAQLERRRFSENNFGNYVDDFECFVCDNLMKHLQKIDKKHYDCTLPKNPVTGKSNWWTSQWEIEKCASKLLAISLKNNWTISEKDFERQKMDMYDKNEC